MKNINNSNIFLYPGSFKPPHTGHFSILETILEKYDNAKIYIIISKKPRYLPISQIPIEPEFCSLLWKNWLDCLKNKKWKEQIKIRIAYFPSPIMDAISLANKFHKTNPKTNIYFIKSAKNKDDERFSKILKNPRFHEWIIEPKYPNIHSRNLRQKLEESESLNEKEFLKYFDHFYSCNKKSFYNLFSKYLSKFLKK